MIEEKIYESLKNKDSLESISKSSKLIFLWILCFSSILYGLVKFNQYSTMGNLIYGSIVSIMIIILIKTEYDFYNFFKKEEIYKTIRLYSLKRIKYGKKIFKLLSSKESIFNDLFIGLKNNNKINLNEVLIDLKNNKATSNMDMNLLIIKNIENFNLKELNFLEKKVDEKTIIIIKNQKKKLLARNIKEF